MVMARSSQKLLPQEDASGMKWLHRKQKIRPDISLLQCQQASHKALVGNTAVLSSTDNTAVLSGTDNTAALSQY